MDTPSLIEGAISVDDRGDLSYVNDFNFKNIRRYYMVRNHVRGFVRAWHAHRREAKYATVVSGAVLFGAVQVDNWEEPSKDTAPFRYILTEKKPAILFIPAGYANGFMALTEDARIIFYSTSSLIESQSDDVRYDARYWDIWNIIER